MADQQKPKLDPTPLPATDNRRFATPRMLTPDEIEELKQKQREMDELWPNLRYLP